MRVSVVALGAIGLLACGAAVAQPLTCELFRDRLNGNLIVSDNSGPEAPVFRERGTGADGSKRLAWSTSSLDGSMTCGPSGEFREFYVALVVTTKERFVEQLKRFVAMNGAAICTTSEATPPACTDAGKLLLQAGLQQMGAAFQKKINAPSGLASRMLQQHLKADLTAAPTLVTFTLDVDEGASIEAARQPLGPLPQSAPTAPEVPAP